MTERTDVIAYEGSFAPWRFFDTSLITCGITLDICKRLTMMELCDTLIEILLQRILDGV